MVNMKTLIRIVFAIFIANGIDCLGRVCDNCCDNCCDCFKKEKEEEKKEEEKKGENNKENNKDKKEDEKKDEENKDEKKIIEYKEIEDEGYKTAISKVNDDWYKHKEDLVLKIFKKKDDETFPSKVNGDKISIKLEENVNSKIVDQNEEKNPLKLQGKKYAFFEIKTKDENTVYLYCSDVESIKYYHCFNGIFEGTTHISISVIACDTEEVTNMWSMFFRCSSLKELDLKNFNTKKVTNMYSMFFRCSSLEKLDLNNFDTTNVMIMKYMFCECRSLTELDLKNFNTTKVTDMEFMFYGCSNLKNLDISNFNTLKVTNMGSMFSGCSRLENLDISNFNTAKDTIMEWMFYNCSSLNVLKIGDNFYTTNDKYKKNMFIRCDKLLQDTKNKILGENK